MTGLDTNILVHPVQARKASEILEVRLTVENPGFISVVVMAETVWVLGRVHRLSAQQIAVAIEKMLQADTLVIQNEREVFRALLALKSGLASFGDALIAALGAAEGCSATLTFDRKAARLADFRLVS